MDGWIDGWKGDGDRFRGRLWVCSKKLTNEGKRATQAASLEWLGPRFHQVIGMRIGGVFVTGSFWGGW